MADKAKAAALTIGLLTLGAVIVLGMFVFPPPPPTNPLQTALIAAPGQQVGKQIVYARNTTIGNITNAIRFYSGKYVINGMAELIRKTRMEGLTKELGVFADTGLDIDTQNRLIAAARDETIKKHGNRYDNDGHGYDVNPTFIFRKN